MRKFQPSPRMAMVLFLILAVVVLVQAVWWVVLMATLVDEKVDLAARLGANDAELKRIQTEETQRQIMIGSEGLFFLVLILLGVWLIYRSLVRSEQLKAQQRNFITTMTHELRTPLASVRLYLDTLESERVPQQKKTALMPRMRHNLDRLEGLIDDVIQAGRSDRNQFRLDRSQFDLVELIEESLQHLPAAEAEIEIRRELPAVQSAVGDAQALSRVLGVVLANAVRYNQSDLITITVKLVSHETHLQVHIVDNGIGITPDEQHRVFDRFYRGRDGFVQQQPGSGLGLYLARQILLAHGGDLTVQSQGAGKGSSFIMTIAEGKSVANDPTG